jgi:hypothetical protein
MNKRWAVWAGVGVLALGLSGCVKKSAVRPEETVREIERTDQLDSELGAAPRATVVPEEFGEVLRIDSVDEEGKMADSALAVGQKTEGDMIVFTLQGTLPAPEGTTFYEVYLMNPVTSAELFAGRLGEERGAYYLQASFDTALVEPYTQVWVTRETNDDNRPEKAILVSPIEK